MPSARTDSDKFAIRDYSVVTPLHIRIRTYHQLFITHVHRKPYNTTRQVRKPCSRTPNQRYVFVVCTSELRRTFHQRQLTCFPGEQCLRGCRYKAAEERVWFARPGLKFGMELTGNVPGMVAKFDNLDQSLIG